MVRRPQPRLPTPQQHEPSPQPPTTSPDDRGRPVAALAACRCPGLFRPRWRSRQPPSASARAGRGLAYAQPLELGSRQTPRLAPAEALGARERLRGLAAAALLGGAQPRLPRIIYYLGARPDRIDYQKPSPGPERTAERSGAAALVFFAPCIPGFWVWFGKIRKDWLTGSGRATR